MTSPRDPDAILAAWLEEGPTELPTATRRAIAVNTRSNPQSRRSSWLPWRPFEMQSYTRLAIAAVVAVVLFGGGAYFLSQGRASVGASPTPAPAVTQSAVPTTAPSTSPSPSTPLSSGAAIPTSWTAVRSKHYAYTAERPTDWVATSGTEDWPTNSVPEPNGPAVDLYVPAAGKEDYILVTSDALDAGETESQRRAGIEADDALYCQIAAKPITVDGVIGQRANAACGPQSFFIEVSVVHDRRFYLVTWISSDPVTGTDTAIFDRFVSSFKFGA